MTGWGCAPTTGWGCAPEKADARAARRAAERYLHAVGARDTVAIRKLAVGAPPGAAWIGAVVLRADPIVSISRRALDSLEAEAMAASRRADSAFASADESTADSLGAGADEAGVRRVTARNAQMAAARSSTRADTIVRFERIRLRVRWGGARVGPEPVDREYVLRLLQAGTAGDWIVFSLRPRDRDTARIPF